MRLFIVAATALGALACVQPAVAAPADDARLAHVRDLLRATPIIDGHNDLPWEIHDRWAGKVSGVDLRASTAGLTPPLMTDIPRLRAGGVGAQFWSVYVPVELQGPAATVQVLEQIDIVHRMVERYPEAFQLAFTADDITRAEKSGRIASLIGVEGGHAMNNSLGVLRALYAGGARYMTLTHSSNTDWADSATDAPAHNGLTPFGREVVREMNRLGMLADLSHVSAKTMQDALEVSQAPVIFSHSSARAIDGVPRNVPDDVLRLVAKNGGVVMANFYPGFVSDAYRMWSAEEAAEGAREKSVYPGDPLAAAAAVKAWTAAHPAPVVTVAQVADHVDYLKKVAGVDHVGIGSDFDGIPATVERLNAVDTYPLLFTELSRRGWSDEDLRKLAGQNLLRAFHQAEAVAHRLQAERPASEATIAELDGPARKPGA